MYHCGTPMVLEHIASGMYGVMIVEPRGGYPTKVDREYAVVQSEFYTKLDPQKRKVDGQPLYVLDGERVAPKRRRIRCSTDATTASSTSRFPQSRASACDSSSSTSGPSNTSSFHVVGTIFDRVWLEGNPDNQQRAAQTVLLGSSNSAIVEFIVPEPGNYVMVDHHFANASQGAIGLIGAGAPSAAARPSITISPRRRRRRIRSRSEASCRSNRSVLACHSIAGGDKLGPMSTA
jgi:nitrite reductase (NO-forming)